MGDKPVTNVGVGGGIFDSIFKKALKHHVLLIVNMGFAYFYMGALADLMNILNEKGVVLQILGMLFYIGCFSSVEILLYKQLEYDSSIRKLIEKSEAGDSTTIKRD
ncbi:MAG: hypothetical protein NTU61_00920 [Candidatus Altiarchaeota archaeon]|nr:hypothetical protein [Candidatus Altiarchaeota archaeon]